jgi:hypothetical protein
VEPTPQRPIPIFPLPNVVLFPGAIVPLHVFEPRYRELVRDALAGERLIGLALLAPGWEREYHGSPAFHPLGCLARCERVTWLPDGHYDLAALGLARVRFGALAREFPYRATRVSVLTEAPLTEDDPLVQVEKRALADTWRRLSGESPERLPALPAGATGFEALVNALATALPASADEKLAWLELDGALERGHRVRAWMERELRSPHAPRPPVGGEWN